jgi:antirestriction protein
MNILDAEKYAKVLKDFSGSTDGPAIFVADYASYNEGHISGTWFDVTEFSDKNEFLERVDEFFKELDKVAPLDFGYPREETMFQDCQSFPDSFYSESCIDEKLWEYLELLEDDEDFENIIEAYEACFGEVKDFQDVKDRFILNIDEEYPDSHASTDEKYGWYCKDSGMIEIPADVESYFDYEAYGRDMLENEHNGYVFNAS